MRDAAFYAFVFLIVFLFVGEPDLHSKLIDHFTCEVVK